MNKEQNIFLAKKLFVELVYNCAYIEGCNVTFSQTQTILDGAIVNNIAVDDIQIVLNLRDAWKYIISNIDNPLDIGYICKINEYVSRNASLEWGVLRTGNIGISGTNWNPDIPDKNQVAEALEKINNIKDPIERAFEYFSYGTRNQLFWDGNKRTSIIIANKILIEHCKGILTIDKKNAFEFNESLLFFYDTNDNKPLKQCLLKCMKSLDMSIEKYSR